MNVLVLHMKAVNANSKAQNGKRALSDKFPQSAVESKTEPSFIAILLSLKPFPCNMSYVECIGNVLVTQSSPNAENYPTEGVEVQNEFHGKKKF